MYSISFDADLVRIVKRITRTFVIFIAVAAVLFLVVMFISRGINYSKHRLTGDEHNDKGMYVTIGGMEQYVHFRSADASNPVIVYLHGGPGSADGFVTYLFADKLDEKYTFVCWDQRGAGRTYEYNKGSDPENATLSFEQSLSDLDELVDFVCERYAQDKVIIMGHSYGSMLGLQYAHDHPEKVSHYIGIGQEVSVTGGESASYYDALEKAKAAGDDTAALEKSWEEYSKDYSNIENMLAVREYTSKYHKPTKQANNIWDGISSPYMNLTDMMYFLRQTDIKGFIKLQKPLLDVVAAKDMSLLNRFDVPVDMIMGEYDWTCPTVCAKDYYESIDAPSKGFHVIEGCGHSPQYDDKEVFAQTVLDILG